MTDTIHDLSKMPDECRYCLLLDEISHKYALKTIDAYERGTSTECSEACGEWESASEAHREAFLEHLRLMRGADESTHDDGSTEASASFISVETATKWMTACERAGTVTTLRQVRGYIDDLLASYDEVES